MGYLALYHVGVDVGVGCAVVVISMDTKKRWIVVRKKGEGEERKKKDAAPVMRVACASRGQNKPTIGTRYMRFRLNDHFTFFSIFTYGIIRILFVQILKWIRQDSSDISQAF